MSLVIVLAAAVAVCVLAAAGYLGRRAVARSARVLAGGVQRMLFGVATLAGRVWRLAAAAQAWLGAKARLGRLGRFGGLGWLGRFGWLGRLGRGRTGRRLPVRPSDIQSSARPLRNTPRALLNAIRRDIAAGQEDNKFIALATSGDVLPRRLLVEFAGQQARVMASNQRSLLYLAARFTDTAAGRFFAELAETSRHAADMLGLFVEAAGARRAELRSSEPLAGCQAYPAYVSWLSLNASAEDAALALAASLGTWGDNFAAMGQGLRENPAFRISGAGERATAFFDIFGVPGTHLENLALSVVREAQEAGRKPVHALGYARLLTAYQAMFWNALAERAEAPG